MPKRIEKGRFLEFYDGLRFLDARDAYAEFLVPGTAARMDDAEDCVLLARLSARLGSDFLYREFIGRAKGLAPSDPSVRYYSLSADLRGKSILSYLAEYERSPELGSDDPALASAWKGSAAVAYACIKDLASARGRLAEARNAGGDEWWIDACEAQALCYAEDWDGAWEAALRSREARPGFHIALLAMRAAGFRTGRFQEAARLAAAGADENQSWESSAERHRFLCLAAERFPGLESSPDFPLRGDWAERASMEAPLADGDVALLLEYLRADELIVRGDYRGLSALAETTPHPFISAVKRKASLASGARFVLPHEPLAQRRNECLPTSAAVVLGALGRAIDVEAFASAATGAGTSLIDARAWLRGACMESVFFRVAPSTAAALVRARIPFVIALQNDMNAHALAAVGIDEGAGLLILHDPSGERFCYVLLGEDGEDEPFGSDAVGMAFRGEGLPDPLPFIPERDRAEAWLEFWNAWRSGGLEDAKGFLDGSGPGAETDWGVRARAALAVASGDPASAIDGMERLMLKRPSSPVIKKELLDCLLAVGDAKRAMETARGLLSERRIPGRELSQPWEYVPPAVVVRCAEYASRSEALPASLPLDALEECLARVPQYAPAYSAVSRIKAAKGDPGGAALPARIAAALAPEAPQFAWMAADALLKERGAEAAIGFLDRSCAAVLGKKYLAAMCLMARDFCAMLGDEKAAKRFASLAAEGWPTDPAVLADRASAAAAAGDFPGAEGIASRIDRGEGRVHGLKAEARIAASKGTLSSARESLLAWNRAEPQSAEALSLLLALEEFEAGPEAAMAIAERRYASYPADEGVRNCLYGLVRRLRGEGAARLFLRSALERDPWDAWIMREIGILEVAEAESLTEAERGALLESAAGLLESSRGIDPTAPANGFLAGRLAQARGALGEAAEAAIGAIASDPRNAGMISQSAIFMAGLGPSARAAFARRLEETVAPSRSRASAFEAAGAIAGAVGVREALDAVDRLLGPDAELLPDRLAFLLDRCGGVLPPESELDDAIGGHGPFADPSTLSLRAKLLMTMGRSARAAELALERVARAPMDSGSRSAAVRLLASLERVEEAEALIEAFESLSAPDPGAFATMAGAAAAIGRTVSALGLVRSALSRYPREPALLSALADLGERFLFAKEAAAACEAALAATGDPGVAILGMRARKRLEPQGSGAVEEAAKTALSARPGHAGLAEYLAQILAERGAHAEALAVLDRPFSVLAESFTRGRRCVVTFQRNERVKAIGELVELLVAYPEYDWGWFALGSMVAQSDDPLQDALAPLGPVLLRFPARALSLVAATERAKAPPAVAIEALAAAAGLLPDHPVLADAALSRAPLDGDAAAALERTLLARFPSHPASLIRRIERAPSDCVASLLDEFWSASAEARAPYDARLWKLSRDEKKAKAMIAAFLPRLREGGIDRASVAACLDALEGMPFGSFAAADPDGWRSIEKTKWTKALAFLETCPATPSGDGAACVILAWLDDNQQIALSTHFHREHPGRFRKGSEGWERLVYELVAINDLDAARREAAGWNGNHGASAWTGWNALVALGAADRESRDPAAIAVASRAYLETLEPDGLTAATAYACAEALLRIGDGDEFLALASDRDTAFSAARNGFWLPDGKKWWRDGMPLLAECLCGKPDAEKSKRALALFSIDKAPKWASRRVIDSASSGDARMRIRLMAFSRFITRKDRERYAGTLGGGGSGRSISLTTILYTIAFITLFIVARCMMSGSP